MEIQTVLGSDIAMIFDECLSYTTDIDATKKSMELSINGLTNQKNHLEIRQINYLELFKEVFILIYVKNH